MKPTDDMDFFIVNTDHRYLKAETEVLFSTLRTISHRRYRNNTRKSFDRYMKASHGYEVFGSEYYDDLDALLEETEIVLKSKEEKIDLGEGLQAISKAGGSSFWDWNQGSFPYFWRWQPEIEKDFRDGTPLWFHEDLLPKNTAKRQRILKDKGIFRMMVEKLVKVRDREFIGKLLNGPIKSLTRYFAVPKGDNDIRMVYDMTASGLNKAL